MNSQFSSTDSPLIDVLRRQRQATVAQIAAALHVTATAVRQRLNRLMGEGFVERQVVKVGRGRPSHHYTLTEKGERSGGSNFADLAVALWSEIREIKDPEVRRGLLRRLATRMADKYGDRVAGETLEERMESLAAMLGERGILFQVDQKNSLPVLNAMACPYPDLAQQDRTVCSMEKMMFSQILGESMRLTSCRLDGESCCAFEPS